MADADHKGPEEKLMNIAWVAENMEKFNAAVEGLESWLTGMKKKGVKDLRDVVEGRQ